MQTQPCWNYFCTLLDDIIEFSEDRYLRIAHAHPELTSDLMDELEAAIVYPDYILLKGRNYKLVKKCFYKERPRWICVDVHFENVQERLWIANSFASFYPIEGEVIYG